MNVQKLKEQLNYYAPNIQIVIVTEDRDKNETFWDITDVKKDENEIRILITTE